MIPSNPECIGKWVSYLPEHHILDASNIIKYRTLHTLSFKQQFYCDIWIQQHQQSNKFLSTPTVCLFELIIVVLGPYHIIVIIFNRIHYIFRLSLKSSPILVIRKPRFHILEQLYGISSMIKGDNKA
jgi:hypothetical protein